MATEGEVFAQNPAGQVAFSVDSDGRAQPASASNPLPVVVKELDGGNINVTVEGDALVEAAALGAPDDSKETDPDAESATIPALLRGILAELQAQTALLTTIAANTNGGGG